MSPVVLTTKTLTVDLSEYGLSKIEGNFNLDLPNVIEFPVGPVSSAEFTFFQEMNLEFRNSDIAIPSIWRVKRLDQKEQGVFEVGLVPTDEWLPTVAVTPKTLTVDLSAYGLSKLEGNLSPNAPNIIEFSDSAVISAEFTSEDKMNLEFRDRDMDVPSLWRVKPFDHEEQSVFKVGLVPTEASRVSISVTNNTEVAVRIEGNEVGLGNIIPGSDRSGSPLEAIVEFSESGGNPVEVEGGLRTPNLLYLFAPGEDFNVYWQRAQGK